MNDYSPQTEQLAMGHVAIHDTVAKILDGEKRRRLLDIPAGKGALALRLKELGFDVYCSDLYPELFKLDGFDITLGDLDGELSYEANSFEHIVCVEGLEHINNPANAVREFARILKSGGMLIVSVPNIMNIEERLKWLFSGYTSHFKPLSRERVEQIKSNIGEEYAGMEEVALHVNPIGYSELRYLLEKNGFELEQIYRDRKKRNAWLFYPIVALIRLIGSFTSRKNQDAKWTKELNSDEVLLGGNTLIFKAKRL